ncbi:MAG: hypothetical protein IKO07_10375 [Clostridia bacterium]|nr:hypothetical protein [Clostridia bacterium]
MEEKGQLIIKWLRKNSGTLLAAAVALLTVLVLNFGMVSVRLDEDALRVSAVFADSDSIAYDDIRAARLVEDFDRGMRDIGVRTLRLQAGTFINDLGTYRLYAYTGVPVCIDVRTDKGHVVFNAASDAATRALYEQLTEKLPDVP